MSPQTQKLEVATVILQQLGGNRLRVMTGATNFVAGENFLQFKLPARSAKNGINRVRVTLTPDDTYTVEFFKIGRAPNFTVTQVSEHTDIYADGLQELFASETGLYTYL
jgi:hypothetical protein